MRNLVTRPEGSGGTHWTAKVPAQIKSRVGASFLNDLGYLACFSSVPLLPEGGRWVLHMKPQGLASTTEVTNARILDDSRAPAADGSQDSSEVSS